MDTAEEVCMSYKPADGYPVNRPYIADGLHYSTLGKEVKFYSKDNYGTTHYYPANELGHLIMFIANTRTLSPDLIRRLKESYAIEFTEVLDPNRER
jgi:hypothetical protein